MSTAGMGMRRGHEAAGDVLLFRRARPDDARECVRLRGMTRENAISEERLRNYGITVQSWAADIESGALPGWLARSSDGLVGYCFGASKTGEMVVLALHPEHEGQGLGKKLLHLVVQDLRDHGHTRLFLGCSADPMVRSYGFYRHLGWKSTGAFDAHGDELLEFTDA
jgi:GNAT superfamily N-acetyltransferase